MSKPLGALLSAAESFVVQSFPETFLFSSREAALHQAFDIRLQFALARLLPKATTREKVDDQ